MDCLVKYRAGGADSRLLAMGQCGYLLSSSEGASTASAGDSDRTDDSFSNPTKPNTLRIVSGFVCSSFVVGNDATDDGCTSGKHTAANEHAAARAG